MKAPQRSVMNASRARGLRSQSRKLMSIWPCSIIVIVAPPGRTLTGGVKRVVAAGSGMLDSPANGGYLSSIIDLQSPQGGFAPWFYRSASPYLVRPVVKMT